MSSGIYVIRNLVNDKLYVGKSVHIENRWLEHQSDLRKMSDYNCQEVKSSRESELNRQCVKNKL